MRTLIKSVDRALSILCILIMAVMTAGVIVSVFLRYVFSISFVQSEEIITMLFIGTTYFGMALGVREKDHISIPYLVDKTPPLIRKTIQVLVMLIIIWVSAVLCQQSILWIRKVGGVPSPATHIPYVYFYLMVPASAIIMIFYALVNMLSLFIAIPDADKGYTADEELAATQADAPRPQSSEANSGASIP